MEMGLLRIVTKAGQPLSRPYNVNCPGECHFKNFSSLAVCAKCETQDVRVDDLECAAEIKLQTQTIIRINEFSEFKRDISMHLKRGLRHVCLRCKKAQGLYPPLTIKMNMTLGNTTSVQDVHGTRTISNIEEVELQMVNTVRSGVAQRRN
ncbi:hypothetical protein BDV95DRAFT_564511 [Massariosphaeria phaeospora]|uniref:Uncharacterized protein n=1 Tax=Massariosphaeria phaeospora TaxID=100035 RepID=A0A7C8MH13_9PLEO|nr:hypothetical protein BDV95DRAFT_564511 [Massariosphaeria phaeospora]